MESLIDYLNDISLIILALGAIILAIIKVYKNTKNEVESIPKKVKKQDIPASAAEDAAEDGEVPIEIRLAIIAAIAAYYEGENTTCEFKVRRIKKL